MTQQQVCQTQWPVRGISLDMTENCSLRCGYCFCGEKTTANIDEETARGAIDWLLSSEVSGDTRDLTVDLWGGEPTLRWDFARDLIIWGNRRAQNFGKRIHWNMTTNGVHWDERLAADAALGNVSFMLSLDGTKETQDKYRPLRGGGSSYDRIVANLPNMRMARPNLRVRMTVREDNVQRMYRDVLHLHSLGFQEISHCLVHESAWTHESMVELEKQFRLIADYYIEQKRRGDTRLWIKWIDEGIGRLLYPRPLSYFCGAGRTYLSVSVHGVIYPCHRFHEFLDDRPWQEQPWALGTVAEGVQRMDKRQWFVDANQQLHHCKGCVLAVAGACSGSCYAVNAVKSGGDIYIPAHSQCTEQRMIYGISRYVYEQLINEPSFKPTLARAARGRFANARQCVEPRIEPEVNVVQAAAAGTAAELDVLGAALRTMQEAVAAIQDVATTGISERQWRLAMLGEVAASRATCGAKDGDVDGGNGCKAGAC